MPNMTLFCRSATTFNKSGALDEDAFRKYLQRFVDARLGVSLASGVSGECNAMTRDELRRTYEIGVEVCKGDIPVYASLPGSATARETIEFANLAIGAGIDIVNVYGPASHGYRPTDPELIAYFDDVLDAIRHPVALAPNPVMGYKPSAALIADVCNRHPHVVTVNFSNLDENYFIGLKDNLKREVETYVPVPGSLHTLTLGATGLIDTHANILPKTHRRYIDLYESGNFEELGRVYTDIKRYILYIAKWGAVRSIKMSLNVLKLPGAGGIPRRPFLLPPDDEIARFTEGLLRLRIPEIDELARAAGLKMPE
jgi:dihydrodipicolinate synthase/N-acetylneuraminate lyase